MSDDNNQKSRGPRKGGGAGGRGGGKDGGPRGGGFGRGGEGRGPVRSGGERKPFRARSEGDERPARRFDKPASERDSAPRTRREDGDRPFRALPEGGRPPFRSRPDGERPNRTSEDGERPARRFDRPAGERNSAPRPRREDGDRPFRARPEGGRPAFRSRPEGERPSRASEGGERPARRFDRPAGERDGAPRPRREDGERPFRARPEGERSSSRPPRAGGNRFERPERPRSHEDRPRRPREETPASEAKLLPSLVSQEPERIAKVMARAGVASRRDSEAMIAEGRVSVNGTVLDSPALDIGPDDVVLVDGEPLPARERTRMWLYHKPRGLVTTNHDPEGRPTVFDALPEELPRVLSIGRLDINTEGLLLLTNDGGLARMLELPETGWLRRYRVRAFGEVTQDVLDTVRDGVTIDGTHYGPVIARFERQQGFNTWLTVDLREGKNREVKTVLEHLGLAVNRLIRISFGPFQLGDLPEGEVDELRSRVLRDQLGEELMAKAGVDFDAPRRDELPAAPRRAPAGDDRPRRRSRDEAGRGEDPARKLMRGDKPWTRTVWRDAETEPQRERKAAPRRGADPKLERQEREASGEVKRQRDKAIADPKGRRVLVERVRAPARDEQAAPEPESRRRPDRKPRNERGGAEERPPRSFDRSSSDRPPRRPREETGGRDRTDERPWQDRAPRGERPERAPRDGAERPARRFSERPAGDKPRGRSFGDRPGGGEKSFGARSSERPAGRSGGGERSGGKPFGARPFGGKPGGGSRPGGGGKGPRPGGPRGKRD